MNDLQTQDADIGAAATTAPVPSARSVLVVEDDPGLRRQMRWALGDSFNVHLAEDRTTALATMAKERPILVVLDLGLPPNPNGASEGLFLLETFLSEYQGVKVIIASGNEERSNALKAISLGAYDFFAKPVDLDQLRLILDRAWNLHKLEEENARLSQTVAGPLDGMIASSPEMMKVRRTVERVAPTDISVLVQGESGTGKEVIARGIHRLSNRAAGPFVAINCAAIPEALLESELFGYERGAFTGAVKRTIGRIEQANGGTLFLDEIGDMPLALQAKLLRFLQDRKFQRLGGQGDLAADVRVVSATNRDLRTMIAQGSFREDVFFRLNEVSILLPPLRDRGDDVLLIANALLRGFAETYRRGNIRFSASAQAVIRRFAWPGNVRELENRLKRAVVMAEKNAISPEDLGLQFEPQEGEINLKEIRQRAETEAILRALSACGNNLTQAAKMLGVSRPTLYNLMSSYEIKVPQ